jgi:hypothetical protein
MRPSGTGTRPVAVLATLLAVLVVAGVVLGVVDGRASARVDDEAAASSAVRRHLTDLVAAPSSPTARSQAIEGATGTWRARLESGTPPTADGSAVVVRAVGLESLDGDSARVVAAARLAEGTSQRAWRVEASLVRRDGRWLVDDLREVP